VAGGPESKIFKSEDGGESWIEIMNGVPKVDLGRIALTTSPQKPGVVYALIAASRDKSGFYKSEDYGEHWVKQSDYIVVDPQYYGEIYADPHQFDKIYCVDVIIHFTEDGGRSFKELNTKNKHVDNHEILFDPSDPDYLLVGSDGGIYESWDRGNHWRFINNLPITQFYRVGIDDAMPFYHVYGGTQDNATLGAPSRTSRANGITNEDWFITIGGDGFQTRIEPGKPDIVYSQYQYAGIVRFDRKTGERVDIQPQAEQNEDPLRWHWDSPLIISNYDPKTLYFACQKIFKSDDRGSSWTAISGDLSRGEDRNKRKVMGKEWPPEAVWKNVFTSPYGTIVSMDESPLNKGMLVIGTDDGLIRITEDDGANWSKIDQFQGVPYKTYIADVVCSKHDVNVIFAVFNNHKEGDFRPFVMMTGDKGKTWQHLTNGIPDKSVAWSLVEDHKSPDLLFLGTEFGLYTSFNRGSSWIQMKGDMPTISIRDLEIHERENDLVAASFGRGMFILDNYSPLRELTRDKLEKSAYIFPVKDAWRYIESNRLGNSSKGSQGDGFYTAPNPPFGAVVTFYLKEDITSLTEQRLKTNPDIYPSWEVLRKEDKTVTPSLVLTISDQEGNILNAQDIPMTSGLHRVAWNLRTAEIRTGPGNVLNIGAMVPEGIYQASINLIDDTGMSTIAGPVSFRVKNLLAGSIDGGDDLSEYNAKLNFNQLYRDLAFMAKYIDEVQKSLSSVAKNAFFNSRNNETAGWMDEANSILGHAQLMLSGDKTKSERAEFVTPGLVSQMRRVTGSLRYTAPITKTHFQSYISCQESYAILKSEIERLDKELLPRIRRVLREADQSFQFPNVPW
jgi:photosystem II stability/assembly factor-like uncharacterized protein